MTSSSHVSALVPAAPDRHHPRRRSASGGASIRASIGGRRAQPHPLPPAVAVRPLDFGAWPFTVRWGVFQFLPAADMLAARGIARAWDETARTVGADILVEVFVLRTAAAIGRAGTAAAGAVLRPIGFAHPYLVAPGNTGRPPAASSSSGRPATSGDGGGIDGERQLLGVLAALRRVDAPPPNLSGIVHTLVKRSAHRILFVPPTTPMGQLLLHWVDAAAEANDPAAPDTVSTAEWRSVVRLHRGLAVDDAMRAGRGPREVLRALKAESQLDLKPPDQFSAAGAIHASWSNDFEASGATGGSMDASRTAAQGASASAAARSGSGRTLGSSGPYPATAAPAGGTPAIFTFRAFEDVPDGLDTASEHQEGLDRRRLEMLSFAAMTRCVFFASGAEWPPNRGGSQRALHHLVHHVLLPDNGSALRRALRSACVTSLCAPTTLGPPESDFYNIVPFNLSWHPFPSLDLISFAIDAPPVSIRGMRVTRGAESADANCAIAVLVTVAGDLWRPAAVLTQLARSWFAQRVPVSLRDTASALNCATMLDLTGVGQGFTQLDANSFSATLLPSLAELYLPLHIRGLMDQSILDLPQLRVVCAAARAPFRPLYRPDSIGSGSPMASGLDLSLATELSAIGADCFRRCVLLQRVRLPPSLRSIGDAVLLRSWAVRTIDLSACTRLSEIGSQFAAWATGLVEVHLPPTIEDFRFSAFRGCSDLAVVHGLDALRPPAVIFGRNSFSGCGLKRLIPPPNTTRVEAAAFSGCDRLVAVDMAACGRLRELSRGAFAQCQRLQVLRGPIAGQSGTASDTNTKFVSIGVDCFADCARLSVVDLSGAHHLERIGAGAFAGCSALTDIQFAVPSALRSIGEGAFSRCALLARVDLRDHVALESVGKGAFAECPSLVQLVLPRGGGAAPARAVQVDESLRTAAPLRHEHYELCFEPPRASAIVRSPPPSSKQPTTCDEAGGPQKPGLVPECPAASPDSRMSGRRAPRRGANEATAPASSIRGHDAAPVTGAQCECVVA